MPWTVDGRAAGFVHRARLPLLLAPGMPFTGSVAGARLAEGDVATRSAALGHAVAALGARGELRAPLGEIYPVLDLATQAELARIDRVAVPWFGVLARGVHLNGFVRTRGGTHLWIARRAAGKRTFGGHLDNVVAGGQGVGFDALATLVKECGEEAAIPPALAVQATRTGVLAYRQQDGLALKVDQLHCYDLELPPDFVPRPVDGEVECFEPWPAAEVAASLRGDALWKPNCALVALDFLLRHGLLDHELPAAERHALWRALRTG